MKKMIGLTALAFLINSQYSYLEYKHSCSLQLIGLTSAHPAKGMRGGVGGYWISRFTQHEIVADLIYRQHELGMLNVGALEAPNLES